jgi:3-oxoacyl-[acyl-carrier-protein] synthase II
MGEGAAMLVIESLDHARKRDAAIMAEIVGYGATSDGNQEGNITNPDPSGGARSAQLALAMAGIDAKEVDYINTHGTGTPMGDVAEIEGIQQWAGSAAGTLRVSSTKSFTGHLLGAAGALETMLSVMSILSGAIPPTYGLAPENHDPACDLVTHIMGKMRMADVNVVLCNAFGFGGTNGTLILRRYAG